MLSLGRIWGLSCELTDWRAHARLFTGGDILDAVFVSNIRDEHDIKTFFGKWKPDSGHCNGPRYWLNGIGGRNRAIYSVTEDLMSSHGRKTAKEQFVAAVKWAEDKGAKVILLAAATKRLFGEDGATLRKQFPTLIFTIGDNGTTLLLQRETFRALHKSGLSKSNSRIAVLGPYGLLGERITQALVRKRFKVIGAGPNAAGLKRVAQDYGIETCHTFDEMGTVDAVIACTHSEKIRLTADIVERIRPKNKKLLVVDVSEPSNMTEAEFNRCNGNVVRQDAGNAYNPDLKYVLGAVSYKMFRLTRGVTFGCFAETMSLAAALKLGDERIKEMDWFKVNDENMTIVEELFQKDGFTIPSPRCFGKPMTSFNLALNGRRPMAEDKKSQETTASETKTCQHCEADVSVDDLFCPECGLCVG